MLSVSLLPSLALSLSHSLGGLRRERERERGSAVNHQRGEQAEGKHYTECVRRCECVLDKKSSLHARNQPGLHTDVYFYILMKRERKVMSFEGWDPNTQPHPPTIQVCVTGQSFSFPPFGFRSTVTKDNFPLHPKVCILNCRYDKSRQHSGSRNTHKSIIRTLVYVEHVVQVEHVQM